MVHIASSTHLHFGQHLLLDLQALLHFMGVVAISIVQLGDGQGLLVDGAISGQGAEELAGHVEVHRLDIILQLLTFFHHLI